MATDRRYCQSVAGTTLLKDRWPGVDLIYWLCVSASKTRLDCAVLVRLLSIPRWTVASLDDLADCTIPKMKGNAAFIGTVEFNFDPSTRELLVAGHPMFSAEESNVAFVSETSGALQVVGKTLIREDLGDRVPDPRGASSDQFRACYVQWAHSVRINLCDRLEAVEASRAFVRGAAQ